MICTKCGAQMHQTDKNTISGRVIHEYECRNCGHFDWADEGVALWRLMHDARRQDEIEAARNAAKSAEPGPCEESSTHRHPHVSFWQRFINLLRSKT